MTKIKKIPAFPAKIGLHIEGFGINCLYNNTFKILRAETDALREQVFRLRYQVFCIENAFENPQEHPDGLEQDAYDPRSKHVLLIHRATNQPIGTIRIILPKASDPAHGFQVHKVAHHPFLNNRRAMMNHCELSRFAISRAFRSRLKEKAKNDHSVCSLGIKSNINIKLLSLAPLGLLRAACELSLDNGLENCVSVMEPRHIAGMEKAGIQKIRRLGEPLEYHGIRQMFALNFRDTLLHSKKYTPHMWQIISDSGRIQKKSEALYRQNHVPDTVDLGMEKWVHNLSHT